MKRILHTTALGLIAAVAGISSQAHAAPTTGNASITIVQPVTVTEDVQLAFGKVVAPSSGSETVTVSPAGVRTTNLTVVGGSEAAGKFTITGTAGESVHIDLTTTASGEEVEWSQIDFTYNGGAVVTGSIGATSNAAADVSLVTGSQLLSVGGVVAVQSDAEGTYPLTYNVDVNYN